MLLWLRNKQNQHSVSPILTYQHYVNELSGDLSGVGLVNRPSCGGVDWSEEDAWGRGWGKLPEWSPQWSYTHCSDVSGGRC